MNIPQVTAGFQIGSVTVTNTMVWTWVIVLILSVFFIIMGSGLKVRNISKKQAVAEVIYGFIKNMVNTNMGEENSCYIPYFLALFSFLIVCNISGFWGLGIVRQPTADLCTPAALAIMTFIITQANIFRTKGFKQYFKRFVDPLPIMLPMNLISEIANPVSLTFRMFGNLLGGLVIGAMIYSILVSSNTIPIWVAVVAVVLTVVLLKGPCKKIAERKGWKKKGVMLIGVICVIPLVITGFVHGYFDIFAGVLQSYIFCMLSMIFITG